MENNTIDIKLTPHQALTILRFITEFNECMNEKRLTFLKMCIDAFEKEVYQKVSLSMLEDVKVELAVNQLFGIEPEN